MIFEGPSSPSTLYPRLTDDDLTQLEGKSEQLAGKLQERYGIAQDEAERQRLLQPKQLALMTAAWADLARVGPRNSPSNYPAEEVAHGERALSSF